MAFDERLGLGVTSGDTQAAFEKQDNAANSLRMALRRLANRWPEWGIDYESAQLAPTSIVRGWEGLRIVLP